MTTATATARARETAAIPEVLVLQEGLAFDEVEERLGRISAVDPG